MSDEADTGYSDSERIPLLQVAVAEAGGPDADAAWLAALSSALDRALEQEFERLVSAPVNAALNLALADYQRHVREVLLPELIEQLHLNKPSGDPS